MCRGYQINQIVVSPAAASRAHKGQRVLVLVADRDVRVLTAEGELLRQLTRDPSRDYQPLS
jgi:hypothetical protein